jgi:hypothetical protein
MKKKMQLSLRENFMRRIYKFFCVFLFRSELFAKKKLIKNQIKKQQCHYLMCLSCYGEVDLRFPKFASTHFLSLFTLSVFFCQSQGHFFLYIFNCYHKQETTTSFIPPQKSKKKKEEWYKKGKEVNLEYEYNDQCEERQEQTQKDI